MARAHLVNMNSNKGRQNNQLKTDHLNTLHHLPSPNTNKASLKAGVVGWEGGEGHHQGATKSKKQAAHQQSARLTVDKYLKKELIQLVAKGGVQSTTGKVGEVFSSITGLKNTTSSRTQAHHDIANILKVNNSKGGGGRKKRQQMTSKQILSSLGLGHQSLPQTAKASVWNGKSRRQSQSRLETFELPTPNQLGKKTAHNLPMHKLKKRLKQQIVNHSLQSFQDSLFYHPTTTMKEMRGGANRQTRAAPKLNDNRSKSKSPLKKIHNRGYKSRHSGNTHKANGTRPSKKISHFTLEPVRGDKAGTEVREEEMDQEGDDGDEEEAKFENQDSNPVTEIAKAADAVMALNELGQLCTVFQQEDHSQVVDDVDTVSKLSHRSHDNIGYVRSPLLSEEEECMMMSEEDELQSLQDEQVMEDMGQVDDGVDDFDDEDVTVAFEEEGMQELAVGQEQQEQESASSDDAPLSDDEYVLTSSHHNRPSQPMRVVPALKVQALANLGSPMLEMSASCMPSSRQGEVLQTTMTDNNNNKMVVNGDLPPSSSCRDNQQTPLQMMSVAQVELDGAYEDQV